MSFLSQFRILTKILMIVGLLSVCTMIVSALGITSLASMNDAAHRMQKAATGSNFAAQVTGNIIGLNRGEFRIAADPRPETIEEVLKASALEMASIEKQLAGIQGVMTSAEDKDFKDLKAAYAEYRKKFDETLELAKTVMAFATPDLIDEMRNTAIQHSSAAENLRSAARTLSEHLDRRLNQTADGMDATYQEMSMLMMIVAGIGIVAGLAIGVLAGQFGVARPIRSIVSGSVLPMETSPLRSRAPGAGTKSAMSPGRRLCSRRADWRSCASSRSRNRPNSTAGRRSRPSCASLRTASIRRSAASCRPYRRLQRNCRPPPRRWPRPLRRPPINPRPWPVLPRRRRPT
jgi:hypothetical protein